MRLAQLKVGILAALVSVSSFAATDFLNVSYDQHVNFMKILTKNLARTGNSVLVRMSILNNHMAVRVNKLVR